VLMESRAPDENDYGQFSICISILRVVYVDRVHIYLPQVWERRGGMQTLGGAAR
jgi:hypothetical protein